MSSDKWKKIIQETKKEQIFSELFIDYSNKKRLAKKVEISKNTLKSFLRVLEDEGYLSKPKLIYLRGNRIPLQKANLNAFFDYVTSKGIKVTKTDRDIIKFIFTRKEVREVAMHSSGKDFFQKISHFLLFFCQMGLGRRNIDFLRYKYKNFLKLIRDYQSCQFHKIKRLTLKNLASSLRKVQLNLPFHFIIKIFRLTIPYGLGYQLLGYEIGFLVELTDQDEEVKKHFQRLNKRIRPSKKEIKSALEEWEEYKKGSFWWEADDEGNFLEVNMSKMPNIKHQTKFENLDVNALFKEFQKENLPIKTFSLENPLKEELDKDSSGKDI